MWGCSESHRKAQDLAPHEPRHEPRPAHTMCLVSPFIMIYPVPTAYCVWYVFQVPKPVGSLFGSMADLVDGGSRGLVVVHQPSFR